MGTFFRRFVRLGIWPRTTMREILDNPRGRVVLPLVLLAALSAFIGNVNENARSGLKNMPHAWVIVATGMLVAFVMMIALFYLFAWVAYMAGKFFEGEGSHADVRAALAWGLVPIIWALLYRLPVAWTGPPVGAGQVRVGDGGWRIEPGQMSGGCLTGLLFGMLELAVAAWFVIVASRTIAEAHRFSAWRGFATLVIICITPIVIVIAAVLSMQ